MTHRRDALAVALLAAKRAGRTALRSFGGKLRVERKPDLTPVTAVDRACEEELRRTIRSAFPDDGFVGEEFGLTRAASGNRWILDPIDGTKSFIRGLPFWGTMVAREEEGRLTLGVIYFPALDELLWARRGAGAFNGRKRLRVSRVSRLRAATVIHGDVKCFAQTGSLSRLGNIAGRTETLRGYSDCWGYLWLCRGKVEAVIEAQMNPWDVAAPKVIVEEAGGCMTGWRGEDSWRIPNSAATNGSLHPALLRILQRAPARKR